MSTMTTERIEIALSNAVAAIRSFGKGGDQRAVGTVAEAFGAGVTPAQILSKSAIYNTKGKATNLPSQKVIVRAAYAVHVLGDLIDAEIALEYARTIGDELMVLLDQQGTSTDVRHATIEGVYAAKADARSDRKAEIAEARKSISAVLPRTVKTLTTAVEAIGDDFELSADDKQLISDLKALIESLEA
jgi:hypothetical protein